MQNQPCITEDVLTALISYHWIVCHHMKFSGDFIDEEKLQNQLMSTSDLHGYIYQAHRKSLFCAKPGIDAI